MKLSTLLLALVFVSAPAIAQKDGDKKNKGQNFKKSDFIIYSTKTGEKVKPSAIVEDLKNYDVLFFGEEHNDSIGHRLQDKILQKMYSAFGDKIAVSMEMFDRDVQYIMDEYLSGTIKQSYFLKDSRKWRNYKDYAPMVEFAKEKGFKVICANAPFRYVNVATHKGMEALQTLSDEAKNAMAPLPYNFATGEYAKKLDAMMGHDPDNPDSQPSYIPGQSLWDATMAYSVYEYLKSNPGHKVLHLNGKFHTDEGFGIIQRLAEYDSNIKPLTISLEGNDENYPKVNLDDYKHLADYVIFTNPKVAKSY